MPAATTPPFRHAVMHGVTTDSTAGAGTTIVMDGIAVGVENNFQGEQRALITSLFDKPF